MKELSVFVFVSPETLQGAGCMGFQSGAGGWHIDSLLWRATVETWRKCRCDLLLKERKIITMFITIRHHLVYEAL